MFLLYLFLNSCFITSQTYVFNNIASSFALVCDNSDGTDVDFPKVSWDKNSPLCL